jgi:hypothetical protein
MECLSVSRQEVWQYFMLFYKLGITDRQFFRRTPGLFSNLVVYDLKGKQVHDYYHQK